jgi:hypothetical protein
MLLSVTENRYDSSRHLYMYLNTHLAYETTLTIYMTTTTTTKCGGMPRKGIIIISFSVLIIAFSIPMTT